MPIIGHTRKAGARAPQRITGINWASPLARGLSRVFWPGRPLEVVDGEALTNDNATPVVGSPHGLAWSFNGSNQRIKFGQTNLPPDGPGHTAACWVRVDTFTNLDGILGEDSFNSGGLTHTLRLQASSGNKFASTLGVTTIYSTTTVTTGRWYFLVHTWEDKVAHRLYVDNVLEGSATPSAVGGVGVDTHNQIGLDFTTGGGRYFAGQIGPVFEWHRRLSTAEVGMLYHGHLYDVLRQPVRTYFIPAAAGGGATTDVPLTTFSISPQAPTTLRALISNVPTL